MTHPAIIVGAGLAGLIAAHAWPQARILEAAPEPRASHKALLRFRSDAVARLTGIEFQKVRVHKGIWHDGSYHAPSIQLANLYARKVTGRVQGDRSIWNLDPVDRFVAPDDLYEQLIAQCGNRITWGEGFDWRRRTLHPGDVPIVSTAPLNLVAAALSVDPFGMTATDWQRAPITVHRFRVPGARAYQTAYFPDPEVPVYRASITGDILIVEYAGDGWRMEGRAAADSMTEVCAAFGLSVNTPEPIEVVGQKFGKISPIDEAARRKMLFRLTHEFNVYSLGRFATWRNILLDDVVNDIDVIKRLLRHADGYALNRAA